MKLTEEILQRHGIHAELQAGEDPREQGQAREGGGREAQRGGDRELSLKHGQPHVPFGLH